MMNEKKLFGTPSLCWEFRCLMRSIRFRIRYSLWKLFTTKRYRERWIIQDIHAKHVAMIESRAA